MIKFNDFIKEIKPRKKEYLRAIARVLDSGWFILGNEVKEFENEFSDFLQVKHCIGVANGLEALQIGLMSLDIKRGDEVITTPISAVATTLAILAVGAKPVFVDVDERGLIDVMKIKNKINCKTRAIIPVHLYGNAVDLERIINLCKKYNLKLIEDACQAHGSKYKESYLGTLGDVGCYSFYPTKNLGAFGDGGAIVTNNEVIAEKCRIIRDYGQSSKYNHTNFGLNSRLDEIQAAILRIKLKHLDRENKIRRMNADYYKKNLSKISVVKLLRSNPSETNNYHQFVIKTKFRDELQEFLYKQNIPTLIHYPKTIPDQPMFGDRYKDLDISNARIFCKEILSLPISTTINKNNLVKIVEAIKKFEEQFS